MKKTTQEIYDETDINFNVVKDNVFWIKWEDIIDKTSRRECLLCKTNLDKDIGKGKWHIPLCKKHRMEELSKLAGYDFLPFGEKIRAREKCQCEDCKNYRKFRMIMLKQQTELEIINTYHNALAKAGIVPMKNKNYLNSKKLKGGIENGLQSIR